MMGKSTTSTHVNRESGFGLVEMMLGATVLAVALMGSASALATGMMVAVDTKMANRANDAALTVIEDFRASCSADFNTALNTYGGLQSKVGNYNVTSAVVLDETRFSPRIDLNGDGDTDDSNLTSAEVNAVYISVKVEWGDGKSMSIVDLLARSEVSGAPAAASGSTGGVKTVTVGGTTGGGTTGGGTTGGGTTSGATTVAAVSSSVTGDKIVMTLDVENGPVTVIGVMVEGQTTSYVKEVKVAGTKVFSDKKNALPVGALIPVSPFQMQSGETLIDQIKFQATPSGGKTSVAGDSFKLTFYHESGETTVVEVK